MGTASFQRLIVVCALALGGGAAVADENRAAAHRAPDLVHERMCFGGLERGKSIVAANAVLDAATETTRRSCRANGGTEGRAPRSPSLLAERILLT